MAIRDTGAYKCRLEQTSRIAVRLGLEKQI
jgi:hypothetical protein